MSIDRRRRPIIRARVEALEPRALLAVAGSLDPSFGGGAGHASIPLLASLAVTYPGSTVSANSVVSAPGGRIVESGTISFNSNLSSRQLLAVAEFNADGTPDTAFGMGGVVEDVINLETFTPGLPLATAVQPDGKIIEAQFGTPGFDSHSPLTVVRLNTDGSLDATFGVNGVALFPSNPPTSTGVAPLAQVGAIAVQSNGQILLAGSSSYINPAGVTVFAAMRLNANGSIDTAYGRGGIVNVNAVPNSTIGGANAAGAGLQSDGKLVLVGTVDVGFIPGGGATGTVLESVAAIRLDADGSLDTTFGGPAAAGIVLLKSDPADPGAEGQNTANGVAIGADDKIAISGYDRPEETSSGATLPPPGNTLYRLDADGTLDANFGIEGRTMPVVSGQVAIQANGSIDVAGQAYPAIFSRSIAFPSLPAGPSYVAQVNPDGTPNLAFGNTSFGGVGVLQVPTPLINPPSATGPNAKSPYLLAIQPTTGDLLVAGVGSTPSPAGRVYADTVAAVYSTATVAPAAHPYEPPPAAFDGSGQTNPAIYNIANGTFYYRTTGSPNLTDVSNPFGAAGAGQSIPAAADYLGNGITQAAVYLPATGTYAIQPTAGISPGVFMQFGIPGAGQSIPTPADFEGTGRADVAIYLPSIASFAIIPSNGSPGRSVQFGIEGAGQSIPAPADYYHTGQADVAVYLAQMGAFAVQDPTGKTPGEVVQFGKPGLGRSIPVPGDYDGSGKTEFAVYIPSVGAFFYRPSNGGNDVMVPIGAANSGQIPAPGDYDGSGHTEVAIYDPAGAFFEYLPARGGAPVTIAFGSAGGGSLPAATPPGDLPPFSGSGSGGNAVRPNFATFGAPAVGPTSSASVTHSSVVPAGPTLASARVARLPINQAAPDPASNG